MGRTCIALCALIVAALMVVLAPGKRASACDCANDTSTVADKVGWSDLAFVGELLDTGSIDPPLDGGPEGGLDIEYRLVVREVMKGVEVGDVVTMFGSTTGTSCGTAMLEGRGPLFAVLSSSTQSFRDGVPRFVADSSPPCQFPVSIDKLRALDSPPVPTSLGPVSIIVEGQLGEAELIAYDDVGQPVAFGDRLDRASRPTVCPGSERFVHLEQALGTDEPALVTSRDTASLEVERQAELVGLDPWLGRSIVDGVVDCRSADGEILAVLMPWEQSPREATSIVSIGSSEGGVRAATTTSLERLSAARFDPGSGEVIGVRNGAVIRVSPAEPDVETLVATVADPAAEPGLDAMFIEPDGFGGWWIGLGDGQFIAERLTVLAHVRSDGAVERWPVRPADYVWRMRASDGQLTGGGQSLTLPELGTAVTGAQVALETDEFWAADVLADGRRVLPPADSETPEVAVVGAYGDAVVLEGLRVFGRATAVPDGPVAAPRPAIVPEPSERFASEWIVAAGSDASAPPSTADGGGAGAADMQTDEEQSAVDLGAVASDESQPATSLWWLAAVVAATALFVGGGWLLLSRRRTSRT
ncbi:MAG: hypothetical protein AAFY28_06050 [Actinomycetota bacterium]